MLRKSNMKRLGKFDFQSPQYFNFVFICCFPSLFLPPSLPAFFLPPTTPSFLPSLLSSFLPFFLYLFSNIPCFRPQKFEILNNPPALVLISTCTQSMLSVPLIAEISTITVRTVPFHICPYSTPIFILHIVEVTLFL